MFIDLFQAISRSYSTKKLMQLHLSNKSTGSNGFTLVETVVVIAVIATLTAIAIPLFFGIQEAAADKLVRYSMIKAYKECKIDITKGDQTPTFTVMLGLHNTNGYYRFYQQYDYIPRKDGYIPPTKIGNCIGPLGAHRIGVRKTKGRGVGGELWLNLDTAEKKEKGDISWDD
tara:strand:+ start:1616 stop:2131 length:516 start_codon:yes stop_codon:yes gene_type:complete